MNHYQSRKSSGKEKSESPHLLGALGPLNTMAETLHPLHKYQMWCHHKKKEKYNYHNHLVLDMLEVQM